MQKSIYINTLNIFLFSIFMFVFVWSSQNARQLERKENEQRLDIIAPAYIQVLMAFGDRYLASNIAVSQAAALASYLVKDKNTYYVQGLLQEQAAILNPRQEDNYYIAAAVLSWEEQTDTVQKVLKLATKHRYWDPMPPFLQGFNEYYFYDKPIAGAKLLEKAAERTADVNKKMFRKVASKWYTSESNPVAAIGILNAMKQSTADEELKSYFDARIIQLEGKDKINQAIKKYIAVTGTNPVDIEVLVSIGLLEKLPVDPFGKGYVLENGKVKINK